MPAIGGIPIGEGSLLREGEESDAQIVARAAVDRAAFAPLFSRYVDPVYRYCFRRLGSREAAQDATSQVFLNALAALPSYKERSFRAWLFTIAHNVVVDAAQRRRHACLEAVPEPADGTAGPEEAALAAARRASLAAALARLPADQRRVVELRLAGLKGAEIAAVLGRSLPAAKMLQSRAFERLRALLGAEDGCEEGGRDR